MKLGKAKVDRTADNQIRRIGLLSPTSGNLGNAAMQSAMIANLRKRIAGVEFVGITLNPAETERRHGIKAFPLAAISRPNYDLFDPANPGTPHHQIVGISLIKKWLKKVPLLHRGWRTVRACTMELAHIRAAAHLVRKLDRIIVPGGGALDDFWGGPWGQPWALFKWSLLSRLYRVPFLFVSIGKCSLEHRASRLFVRIALRLAEYRSYRDHSSKIAVQSLIDAPNDPVYPDLAFSHLYSAVPTVRGDGSPEKRLIVGVSPMAYCDPRAWPRQDERRYSVYISQLAEMVKWLIRERYRVLLFTTDSPDSAAADDLQARIRGSASDADLIQTLPGSTEQSPDSLLKGLSCADLVIASRLHGVILSHLNLTPVLALSFDPKVDAHMSAVGQENYCLNINHLQIDTLIERFTALKAARQREQSRLRSCAMRFRHLLDQQYDGIVGTPRYNGVDSHCHNQINAGPLAEIGAFRTR